MAITAAMVKELREVSGAGMICLLYTSDAADEL